MRYLIFCITLLWLLATEPMFTPKIAAAAPTANNDCVTTTSGDWNDPATWTDCGGATPGATDNVYVQSGHVVSLVQNEAVNDLHVSTGTTTNSVDGAVAIGAHQLDLYGKLRTYKADIGTVPGDSNNTPGAASITITPGQGRLRVAGDTRTLTYSGEWGAPTSGSPELMAILVDLNAGSVVTAETTIKASLWTIANGTLNVNTNRIAVDNGTTGQGDITIGEDGVLISAASGSSSPVFHRSSTNPGGMLTVSGSLVLEGASPYIYMQSIQFAGTVRYGRDGNQNLASAGSSSGATPAQYQVLELATSGTKTLSTDTTIVGTLVRGGVTALNRDVWTLTYGPNAGVLYAGSITQTTGLELPDTALADLAVDNSNGIVLAQDLELTRALTVTTGDLETDAFTLTLGSDAVCAGSGDVTGRVHRADLIVDTTYCFGHPDVQINVAAGSSAPTSLNVDLQKGTPPFPGAVTRAYTITAPNFAGTATLRLHYTEDELNGNPVGDVGFWRWDDVRWNPLGKSSAGPGYVEQTGITTFSPWALASQGETTATTIARFTAQATSDGTVLQWQTAGGTALLGFRLYRSGSLATAAIPLTVDPISAQEPGALTDASYSFVDTTVEGSAYYWLEVIELNGNSARVGPINVGAAHWYLPICVQTLAR